MVKEKPRVGIEIGTVQVQTISEWIVELSDSKQNSLAQSWSFIVVGFFDMMT
jgi:hypothetical protein